MRVSRGRGRQQGISLVELMTVLLIVGVLAAVATPGFTTSLTKYRADGAAQRIVTDLARTQALAYSTSTTQTISFTVAQSKYQILGLRDMNRVATTYTVDLTAEPYRAALVSANFGGLTRLSYDGYGQPTVAGGTVVVSSGGQQRTITVDSSTGKGTIQ